MPMEGLCERKGFDTGRICFKDTSSGHLYSADQSTRYMTRMDDEERVIAVLQSAGLYSPLTHIKLL
jgi:hypothetical protein